MSDQKVAVVTGANKGLGLQVCRELGKLGYRVLLTARNQANGEAGVEQLKKDGIDAQFHILDVTSESDARDLADFVKQNYGQIDTLVNNAGVYLEPNPTEGNPALCQNTDTDMILKVFDTNTLGALRVSQALIPLFKNGSRIVNVSSGLGALTDMGGGSPGYRLSKTAMNAITRMLSSELSEKGILVNSVCPGWVRTDMGGSSAARSLDEGASGIVWAATLDAQGPTGGFFRDGKAIDW